MNHQNDTNQGQKPHRDFIYSRSYLAIGIALMLVALGAIILLMVRGDDGSTLDMPDTTMAETSADTIVSTETIEEVPATPIRAERPRTPAPADSSASETPAATIPSDNDDAEKETADHIIEELKKSNSQSGPMKPYQTPPAGSYKSQPQEENTSSRPAKP